MDARISDVIVTLDKRWEDKLDEAIAQLRKAGLQVDSTDDENNIVEGCIDVGKVRGLQKLDCVDYVRTVFTYDASFPPGDPRDRDGQ